MASMKQPTPPESERRALASGLHIGVIELAVDGRYKLRLVDGALVDASLSPQCEPALADECLRERRTVLAVPTDDELLIVGALQTRASAASVDRDGAVDVRGARVELEGAESVAMRAGDVVLELRKDGTVRIAGNRMTLDIAALVKVLSARMELP